ncbi:MAG: hypothetical protein IJ203_11375 [Atopobiaceae bacterium]|nr:hypothetical protein [Atopobiaceae bacterium]
MTAQQAMRMKRRRIQAEQQRKERIELLAGIAALIFILIAFAIAGTMDYQDEQRELAYWESQGIHIVRDW